MKVQVQSRKEMKEIVAMINEQFGASFSTELVMFLNNQDVYISNREAFEGVQDSWRVNQLGLYLGELKGDAIRLSIEGSQLVGPSAAKNVLELSQENIRRWLMGEHIELEHENTNYVIIAHKGDFFGCGKVKDGNLLNFVPKSRRINAVV